MSLIVYNSGIPPAFFELHFILTKQSFGEEKEMSDE